MKSHGSHSLLRSPSYPLWRDSSPFDQDVTKPDIKPFQKGCQRNKSSSSLFSTSSVITRPLQVRNENVVPSRTISLSTLDVMVESMIDANSRKPSERVSRRSSRDADFLSPLQERGSLQSAINQEGSGGGTNVRATSGENFKQSVVQESDELVPFPRISIEMPKGEWARLEPKLHCNDVVEGKAHPFRRWMSTLHRRNRQRRKTVQPRIERWCLNDSDMQIYDEPLTGDPKASHHKKSSSFSSSGFVSAVKSASISLATLSVAPHSRKGRRSTLIRSSNRSSWVSNSLYRPSMDKSSSSVQIFDEGSRERAIKRRQILEEMVTSEEGYVADLKALVNVYFTLLATATPTSQGKLSHIHDTITEILVLHEEILENIRTVTQRSEKKCAPSNANVALKAPKHTRGHSLDYTLAQDYTGFHVQTRRSLDVPKRASSRDTVPYSEPEEGAEIARIFENVMARFFVYEEYGASYESMLYDINLTSKSIPNWQAYERGIEALANTLAPDNSRDGSSRKGLTFGDLLIKPIQRVCRYPLLFADLFKNLPVIDGPESHAEVEKVLFRLRETALEINKATNDEYTRERIQRSWSLQDLLIFPDPAAAPFTVRSLGHATLCGVLHVAYQSKQGVLGGYTLCALFRSCLILALPINDGRHYKIAASISLTDLRIENADNGKGLQCHTALFSWKVVFEADQQLFELILSACTPEEEKQWKNNLIELSAAESQNQFEEYPISPARYSALYLAIRPIGSILGQPGTLARRISIQRAATMGPRTNVCQVFIRNTHALRDSVDSSIAGNHPVGRSQSLLTTNRIPVLAPKRMERMRMEQDLSKVWTKEMLPYPGMGGNRGDHANMIRASASSVMRKLSRASIASGFSKRSTSFASLTNSKFDEVHEPSTIIGKLDTSSGMNSMPLLPIGESSKIDAQGALSFRSIVLPDRTSSRKGPHPKGKDVSNKENGTDVSEGSSFSKNIVRQSGNVQERTLRNRWSSPISLIRSFSTEGMKGFFT